MTISPTCLLCGDELDVPGAILLGPPNPKGWVRKDHLCQTCHTVVRGIIQELHDHEQSYTQAQ